MACLLEGENEIGSLIDGLVHLVDCGSCRARFRQLYPERSRALLLQSFGTEDPPRIPTDRLREGLHEVVRDIRESGRRLTELLSHPAGRRSLLVRNSRRYQTIGIASQLLEEARVTWDEDVWSALEMTELALVVLRRLSRLRGDIAQLNDLLCRAFVFRGNCRRIVSQLRLAERDFERARIYVQQGKGYPQNFAFVDEYESSLRRAQCRFDVGGKLARRARKIYKGLGDVKGEARLIIVEAMNQRSSGDQASACRNLRYLLAAFQPHEIGWQYILMAKHNLATYLTELGRAEEAQRLLPELYRLYEVHGQRFQIVRLCWVEAMILEQAGDIDAAAERYEEVRDFFVEQGIGYDAALVCLDLSALYLTHGRHREAKELAAGLVPLLEAHEIHREASAALALFCQAVQCEKATAALAKDVAKYLQVARDRDDLRYEPPPELQDR